MVESSSIVDDSRGRKLHKQPAEKPLSPDRPMTKSQSYNNSKMFSSAPDARHCFSPTTTTEQRNVPSRRNSTTERRSSGTDLSKRVKQGSGPPVKSPPGGDICDDLSDTGTYTIDESPTPEVEQARKNIDTVFGVRDAGYHDNQDIEDDEEENSESRQKVSYYQGCTGENQLVLYCARHPVGEDVYRNQQLIFTRTTTLLH